MGEGNGRNFLGHTKYFFTIHTAVDPAILFEIYPTSVIGDIYKVVSIVANCFKQVECLTVDGLNSDSVVLGVRVG